MKTEVAKCWGLRVEGPRPYLAYEVNPRKEEIKLTEPYHRAVKVVIVPLNEWRTLNKIANQSIQPTGYAGG